MKSSQKPLNGPQERSTQRRRKAPAPIDSARLEELALAYVARFATSAGRLRAYCLRKLRERGHVGSDDGDPPPDVEALVARFVANGFVDDVVFARAKTGGLLRRGYGARRVGQVLRADGIAEEIREDVDPSEADRRGAAAAYARRRRLGPYAREQFDPRDQKGREKQLAALMRAGHDSAHARQVVTALSIGDLEDWIAEARDEEDRNA